MSRQRTLKGTDGLDVPRLWQLMLLRLNVKLLRDCNRKAKYLLDVGNLVGLVISGKNDGNTYCERNN